MNPIQKIPYQLLFYSNWHVGSGLSASTYADSTVLKDANMQPYVPGKAVKGLIRESAEILARFQPASFPLDFIQAVFGSENSSNSNPNSEGGCFFSNATLSPALARAIENNHLAPQLYKVLASTSIGENGVAKSNSLRQMEVSIPMTLEGEILIYSNASDWVESLKFAMKGVKRLGMNRHRGLGRCEFTFK